ELSDQLHEAFVRAAELYTMSDGRFDITVCPLRRLWKGAAKAGVYPSPSALKTALALVGPQHYRLEGKMLVILTPGVSFDFGGLIKGISVDHVMEKLKKQEITGALIQVGGETGCFGTSVRGKKHAVAIPNPDNPRMFWSAIRDQGTGFSGCTSGNYRLPIVINGKKYYHIFDPRSGLPGETHVLSVSLLFPETGNNGLCDGLSTTGVIMGPEEFIPLVEKLGGEAMVLTRAEDGKIVEHKSANWDSFIAKK
ncbi:MAG: FAD:protein FMN transferase, partial [Planctomycetes bacterium]|nr:FAD:protein FMN transferase [Planctomycetota bacterium]